MERTPARELTSNLNVAMLNYMPKPFEVFHDKAEKLFYTCSILKGDYQMDSFHHKHIVRLIPPIFIGLQWYVLIIPEIEIPLYIISVFTSPKKAQETDLENCSTEYSYMVNSHENGSQA